MDAFGALSDVAQQQPANVVALAVAAVVAGAASSLHCFAMCGPLACYACSKGGAGRLRAPVGAYHLSRIIGYTVLGAVAGLGGAGLLQVSHAPPRWIPWAMAAVLVATALGLGKRSAAIPGVAKIVRAASVRAARLAPTARSLVMGALTPLLPCGLLYGLYATAFATGGWAAGGVLAGAFALGSTPSLVLAQLQTGWMKRLPRGAEFVLSRLVPLMAAAMLVYRALTPEHCPLCQ